LLWLQSSHSATTEVYLSSRQSSVGDKVRIAGFGVTDKGGCGKLHNSDTIGIISCNRASHIACAGSGRNSMTSSCGGDSGAPYYKSSDNRKYYVVGVNVAGNGKSCGAVDKESIIVRTSSIRSWIESHSTPFKWANEGNSANAPAPAPTPSGSAPTPAAPTPSGWAIPPPPGSGSCKDKSSDCKLFKRDGACSWAPGWMRANCKSTCGWC